MQDRSFGSTRARADYGMDLLVDFAKLSQLHPPVTFRSLTFHAVRIKGVTVTRCRDRDGVIPLTLGRAAFVRRPQGRLTHRGPWKGGDAAIRAPYRWTADAPDVPGEHPRRGQVGCSRSGSRGASGVEDGRVLKPVNSPVGYVREPRCPYKKTVRGLSTTLSDGSRLLEQGQSSQSHVEFAAVRQS